MAKSRYLVSLARGREQIPMMLGTVMVMLPPFDPDL